MMDLKKIMAISGYPGLFKLVTQGKNNIIVESLLDKKRMPAFASHKVSTLEDIAVFTEEKDMPLKDVLKAIYEKEEKKECIDPKSDPEKLKEYFAGVVPDYNKEKVYASDIKKILTWYNLLLKNELIDFTEEEVPAESEVKTDEQQVAESAEATDKKPAAKAKKSPSKTTSKPKNMTAPKGSVKAKGKTTAFSSKKGGE
jgi:hypothetical protein